MSIQILKATGRVVGEKVSYRTFAPRKFCTLAIGYFKDRLACTELRRLHRILFREASVSNRGQRADGVLTPRRARSRDGRLSGQRRSLFSCRSMCDHRIQLFELHRRFGQFRDSRHRKLSDCNRA